MSGNSSGVGIQGDDIIVLFPKSKMSKEEAVDMAAWIVALTDETEFKKRYEEVMAT